MIRSIKEAEMQLRPYVPLVAQLTGKDTTLERIRPLMKLLGNPQERLRIIHIAGTSGKTSTAYYEAAMLKASQCQVGLTISPHVDSITERIQINGQPLSEKEFCSELSIFIDIIQKAPEQPSYFELLYAFALWVFERKKVDYAVVETGMGGLHDATNIAERQDKICIITDIGFDHMHVLGHTLPEIARQKIGIAHRGNTVLMYRQADEIMKEMEGWTVKKQATLKTTSEEEERIKCDINLSSLPHYQQRNWLLAYHAYRYVAKRDALPEPTKSEIEHTLSVQVPGRMDVRKVQNKLIVMDGAHNAQKMAAFVDSFKLLYPQAKPVVLIAMKEGKEYQEVVPLLAEISKHIVVTTFETSQDLPARSIDPGILAASFHATNQRIAVEAISNQARALEVLFAGPEDVCIITGSFYLLSQIREKQRIMLA